MLMMDEESLQQHQHDLNISASLYNEQIQCYIEIISCRDLQPLPLSPYSCNRSSSDRNLVSSSIDPYVEVRLGNKETFHHTNQDQNTFNPNFLSTFKFQYSNAKAIYDNNGLNILVKDWNVIDISHQTNILGETLIPYDHIVNADNIPREYRITRQRKAGEKQMNCGHIKVRCYAISAKPDKSTNLDDCTIQILSCRNLLAADQNDTSDPYVKLWLGEKQLHRTDHVNSSLNPFFYVTMQSRYELMSQNALEVFQNDGGGITIEIMDYDANSSDDSLGRSLLPYEHILQANNIPREYPITIPQEDVKHQSTYSDEVGNAGYVTIKVFNKNKKKTTPIDDKTEEETIDTKRDLLSEKEQIEEAVPISKTRSLNTVISRNENNDSIGDTMKNQQRGLYRPFQNSLTLRQSIFTRTEQIKMSEIFDDEIQDSAKKKKRRILLSILSLVILILLCVGYYNFYLNHKKNDNDYDTNASGRTIPSKGKMDSYNSNNIIKMNTIIDMLKEEDNELELILQHQQQIMEQLKGTNDDVI